MENVREYRHIDLAANVERAERLIADPAYRSHKIFTENLIGVERYQTNVTLDRPIHTGAAVLELPKLLMFEFHYDFMKKHYPASKSTLNFTDTDSLLYSVETEDIHRDMVKHAEHFDFSNFPDSHRAFKGKSALEIADLKEQNNKTVGKMKDEAGGEVILEFVGLRAKAYAFLQETWDVDEERWKVVEKKKLKGIKKSVVKKKILFEHYKACLFQGQSTNATMITFRSYLHKLSTIQQTKKALSRFDDKRYILPCGVKTRPHGHRLNQ